MDEKLKKALDFANFQNTFANQKRILSDKYQNDLMYYNNGGKFTVTKELVNFVYVMQATGQTNVHIADDNQTPIEISVNDFLDDILSVYFTATNEYHTAYKNLSMNRSVDGLIDD